MAGGLVAKATPLVPWGRLCHREPQCRVPGGVRSAAHPQVIQGEKVLYTVLQLF